MTKGAPPPDKTVAGDATSAANGFVAGEAMSLKRPNVIAMFASAAPSDRQSQTLLKTTQTLGWRNRYSQAELYPIDITSPSMTTPIAFRVRQVQRGETDGTYGTGATVWPASMVLIKYLQRIPNKLKNRTVIDLGAGTCVASIAAAALGARLVVCTDGNDHVMQLAEENVDMACRELKSHLVPSVPMLDTKPRGVGIPGAQNRRIGSCEVRVRTFWWGRDDAAMLDELPESRRYYDVILVSDCVLPKLYPIEPLVKSIAFLSGPNTTTYISYEHRYFPHFDPRDRFRELARDNGLQVRVVSMEEQDPKYSVEDIEIWEVTKNFCEPNK